MDTTFTLPPSLGAEFRINNEGNIIISQGEDFILLTPQEAEQTISILRQLLLKLNQES